MTTTLVVNLDVGNYSGELGTAERMPNGNYVFDSGSQAQLFGQSIEMLPRWHQGLRSGGCCS